jgi:hypothetical protein
MRHLELYKELMVSDPNLRIEGLGELGVDERYLEKYSCDGPVVVYVGEDLFVNSLNGGYQRRNFMMFPRAELDDYAERYMEGLRLRMNRSRNVNGIVINAIEGRGVQSLLNSLDVRNCEFRIHVGEREHGRILEIN